MKIYSEDVIERFWKKVKISTDSDCWDWTASKNKKGYGTFGTGKKDNGKPRIENSHRVAYKIAKGKIPDGRLVCHHCDNPSCCNPSHLFLGTHQDNVDDMVQKGRQVKGKKNGRAKLKWPDVQKIRETHLLGETSLSQLARENNVSHTTIINIVNQVTWKTEDWEKLPLAK